LENYLFYLALSNFDTPLADAIACRIHPCEARTINIFSFFFLSGDFFWWLLSKLYKMRFLFSLISDKKILSFNFNIINYASFHMFNSWYSNKTIAFAVRSKTIFYFFFLLNLVVWLTICFHKYSAEMFMVQI
jgi:hypothetical protein